MGMMPMGMRQGYQIKCPFPQICNPPPFTILKTTHFSDQLFYPIILIEVKSLKP